MINPTLRAIWLTLAALSIFGCGSDLTSERGTAEDSVFIISAGHVPGNAGYANFEARCRSALNNFDDESLGKVNVRPFLSSAAGGNLKDLLPIDSDMKVRSMLNGGLRVVEKWEDLWQDPPLFVNPISTENLSWHSGSTVSGVQLDDGSCNNGLWNGSPFGGVVGNANAQNGLWVHFVAKNCSDSHLLLCLAH